MIAQVDWKKEMAIRDLADTLRRSTADAEFIYLLGEEITFNYAGEVAPVLNSGSASGIEPAPRSASDQSYSIGQAKSAVAKWRAGLNHGTKAIVLIEMGDSYEAVFEDAGTVSRILGLRVFHRRADMPVVLIHRNVAEGAIGKLIEAGYKVGVVGDVTIRCLGPGGRNRGSRRRERSPA